jgi:hypothetical protein
MVLKNTISEEVEQQIDLLDMDRGEGEVPCDEVDDLLELPALIEHARSIDENIEEDQYVEEESPLPPRKRFRPLRYCD